ncbi:aquaporin [Phytoactinopolyspora limicola]|uniref:aquaporin n=1 Tax=Phytoactinopolyspora limicola TaxID=2715536 RepID=UPI00140907FC|nr:aquaporin [Phytoactinopolyspora limicola]
MPQMWVRNAVAEGIGAFALTFVAVMTIVTGDITPYAVGQGMVILVLVAALGHVSGGHFNPAVTLAFLLGRRIDVVGASIYWAAQLIGGIVAALTVLLVTSRDLVAAGVPVPATEGDLNLAGAMILEAIAVFIVVLVVLGTIVDQRAPLSVYPFAIGLAYTAGIFAIGGFSGGALNPARAFGPAVVGGEWDGFAAWLIGPLVGGVLAWLVFEYVIGRPTLDDEVPAEPVVDAPTDAHVGASPTTAAVRSADTANRPAGSGEAGADPASPTPQKTTAGAGAGRPLPTERPDPDRSGSPERAASGEAPGLDQTTRERRPGPRPQQPPPPPPVSRDLPASHKGLLDE